jgi:phosphoenolpyruvate-protein kinase (PTS system EI component)
MISGIEELRGIRRIYESAQKTLRAQKVSFASDLPFGIMIEVPSAVQMVEHLIQEADFLSVGTNDLIQYTLAVDRNNEKVAGFFEPLHPAVIASIARVAQAGEKAGKRVGVCGEMAGDPKMASLLVGLGITQLSMIPQNVPRVKKTIRQISYQEASEMAQKVREQRTVDEVKALLKPFWERLE